MESENKLLQTVIFVCSQQVPQLIAYTFLLDFRIVESLQKWKMSITITMHLGYETARND